MSHFNTIKKIKAKELFSYGFNYTEISALTNLSTRTISNLAKELKKEYEDKNEV